MFATVHSVLSERVSAFEARLLLFAYDLRFTLYYIFIYDKLSLLIAVGLS